MDNSMHRNIILLVIILVSACSGRYKHTLQFDTREPLRVAVLPFIEVDRENKIVERKESSPPAVYLRKLVQNELRLTGLDVLSPGLVDSNLSHNGFDDVTTASRLNLEKIQQADPKDLCTRVFSCDAVIFGKVTAWSQDYYGIQSVNSVGLDLKMYSAKDRKILFSASAEDSESRGLTKGPTGFSDLLIEPVRGLDRSIINELALATVKNMLKPLRVESRPEFLTTAPPAIYASAHDAPAGILKKPQILNVLLFGSANKTASFSIGKAIENVPMIEKDKGHYIGKYFPLPNDAFQDQDISVALTDEFGRTTRQTIGTSSLSLR
jgi:hypothetical protein